jgi:probable F420-dependent oxidoreductase
MHPFRFGVTASRGYSATLDAAAWPALARRVETAGYERFLMPDHLGSQLSPIAALATAAAVTSTLRIGSYVFANDYRHPLVLAREMATLDVLSGGRLELGLGAGWKRSDYRQLGLSYERPGLRIDRMLEALQLIRRLWSGERVSFSGVHYRTDAARLWPLPVQQPMPPLTIGGGGPRLLRIAAREADRIGLLPQFDTRGRPIFAQSTEAATEAKVKIIREAAKDRLERLELNVLVADCGLVGGPAPLGASAASWLKSMAAPVVGGSPYVLYGTLERLREQLLRRRERLGISTYIWSARHADAMAPLVDALAGR